MTTFEKLAKRISEELNIEINPSSLKRTYAGYWQREYASATSSKAGLMSAADKSLLSPATTSSNGLMSATDKTFIESEKNRDY